MMISCLKVTLRGKEKEEHFRNSGIRRTFFTADTALRQSMKKLFALELTKKSLRMLFVTFAESMGTMQTLKSV